MYAAPPEVQSEVFTELPQHFRKSGRSAWADANKRGAELHSFIEGPSFDLDGNLYVVDIPWGRIFRISPDGEWELAIEYNGWPNGLRVHQDGTIYVADYKNGIMHFDPVSGQITPFFSHYRSEGLKGANDLAFASNGDLYFTDQGQTGLQDPSGRVFRLRAGDGVDCLVDTVPSPNGLVLNIDESALLVGACRANAIWTVPLHEDGGTSKVSSFIQMSGGGGPDGLALDESGGIAICHAGLGSIWLFSELGEPLLRVRSCRGLSTTNLAYGGDDNRDIYATESESGTIIKARMPTPGKPLYSHIKKTI